MEEDTKTFVIDPAKIAILKINSCSDPKSLLFKFAKDWPLY